MLSYFSNRFLLRLLKRAIKKCNRDLYDDICTVFSERNIVVHFHDSRPVLYDLNYYFELLSWYRRNAPDTYKTFMSDHLYNPFYHCK